MKLSSARLPIWHAKLTQAGTPEKVGKITHKNAGNCRYCWAGWTIAIPEEMRPAKDQPYYHLFAENAETTYIAYVSEQNLLPDESGKPVSHPQIGMVFSGVENGRYVMRNSQTN